jgi:hypothetical protein
MVPGVMISAQPRAFCKSVSVSLTRAFQCIGEVLLVFEIHVRATHDQKLDNIVRVVVVEHNRILGYRSVDP